MILTNYPRGAGLSSLRKISKLANKRGTPLTEVKFGTGKKKFVVFVYSSGVGTFIRSYPSLSGITKELARLE